jgi:hypothetical protein
MTRGAERGEHALAGHGPMNQHTLHSTQVIARPIDEVFDFFARPDTPLEAEVSYGVDGVEWSQSFTARILDESALRELLAGEGLELVRWLDRPGWFVARSAT